ncbi:MAG TPA: AAA family ATPase [Candidatus Binatia bacterium]
MEPKSADALADSDRQDAALAFLSDPASYPDSPEITHTETHISHLFFAGDLVFKIKKPVRFSFLDYSTREKRRYFLDQELTLNRRLAPTVYLAVAPVTAGGVAWKRTLPGEVLEYALVMRRLPQKQMLPALLAERRMTPEMIGNLADVLAEFHKQARRVLPANPAEQPAAILREWQQNLSDIRSLPGHPVPGRKLDEMDRFGRCFVEEHRDRLISRAAEGWIRDGHGDLHCEHVCFARDGIQIFDCLEFSTELRTCDVASEIAFLTMDLKARDAEAFACSFISRYCDRVGDRELLKLLPFFECYRALVRGKVHVLRSGAADPTAARYFNLALSYLSRSRSLVIVCGLTGSGKSVLARRLGERLKMRVINSDVVRKGLAGKPRHQNLPFKAGIYNDEMTDQTYDRMAEEARVHLKSEGGVIVDATFRLRNQRRKFVQMAEHEGAHLCVIHCFADARVIKKRLESRAQAGTDISDGRWEIYLEQAAECEPLDEVPAGACIEINTDAPVEELVDVVEDFMRRCRGRQTLMT